MPRFLRPASVFWQQWPLLSLIAFISAVFLLQVLLGYGFQEHFMAVPADILSALQSIRSGEFGAGAAGEMFTLFSYSLLHGDFEHLSGNMLFLWIFAAIAAELLGHRWVFITFVFTAICGGACHVALNAGSDIPMLGASGAVTGFEGLYLAMAVRWRLPDPHVWPIARPVPPSRLAIIGVVGLILDFTGYIGGDVGIAHGAHLGGFIGGLFLGSFIVPMPRVALPR